MNPQEHFRCPECDSTGWAPRERETKPLENLGATRTFRSARFRRYLCRMCGYAFSTVESVAGPIDRETVDRITREHTPPEDRTLFDDGD